MARGETEDYKIYHLTPFSGISNRAVPKPPPTREASEDTVGEGWLAVGY